MSDDDAGRIPAALAVLHASGTEQIPPTGPPLPPLPAVTDPAAGIPAARRRILLAARSAMAVITAVLLLATGYQWGLLRKTDAGLAARRVAAVNTADPNIVKPAPAPVSRGAAPIYPVQNILLFGSDTRAGANANPGNSGGQRLDSAQSDVLMLAHISADRQHITIVSLPRDLQIQAPHCKEWDYRTGKMSSEYLPTDPGETWKITNAYAVGGPACTVTAVQELTGIGITSVIGIDFEGFKTMVDALHGVTVNICRPIFDAELNTVVRHGGIQTIHGDQALNLVRARKVKGDPSGDLGRIRRQQVVLSALLQQAASADTLLNPSKLNGFLTAFVNSTFTDHVTVESLVELARSLGNLSPSKVTFYTIPTQSIARDRQGLVEPAASEVFRALINDQRLPRAATNPTTRASTSPSAPPAAPSAPSAVLAAGAAHEPAAPATVGRTFDSTPPSGGASSGLVPSGSASPGTRSSGAGGVTAPNLQSVNAGQLTCA